MRYIPGGDFTRNEHQREVIQAIIDQAAGFSSFTRYHEILEAIGNNVKTNLTFDEMKYIALNYKDAKNNIVNYEVKGTTDTIDGISYVLVSEVEREKVSEMIKEQLKVGNGHM
jgi:anionic cell wall polymer biosynthesis LytR-Cps2A-Psr (LCP) family protein